MSKPVDNIIKICLDGSLTGEALVKALEEQVAQIMPYKHSEETPMEACNIPCERMIVEIKGSGTISEIVEKFERTLTKRMMAFAFVHQAIEEKFGTSDGKGDELDDFLSGVFGDKKKSRDERGKIPQELIELLKAAKGQQSEDGSDCDAEDLSECWKCKKRTGCKRFNAN